MTVPAPSTGELRLAVGLRSGRPVITEQFHQGALRVLRPRMLAPGCLGITVVNPGGGFLAGDHYRTDISVRAGAGLEVTSQSATKVYRSPGPPTRQVVHLSAGPGAFLDHRPEPLILYRDADFDQDVVVDVDPGACVIVEDILTAGWSPDGRTHNWRSYRNRTTLTIGGRRCLTDVIALGGGDADPTTASLRRRSQAFRGTLDPVARTPSHLGTLLLTGPGALSQLAGVRDLLATARDVRGAAGPLAQGDPKAGGIVGGAVLVRAVGPGTEPLQAVFACCADLVRAAAGMPPREQHQW